MSDNLKLLLSFDKAEENERKAIVEFFGNKETNDDENLQPVDAMIGHYAELLSKEISDKKVLQARINLLLQK